MAKRQDRDDLIPGTLDMLVLKTLSLGSMHGYGIAQHIQQTSQDLLQVEEGSIYPALQRMALKGWITSEWRVSPTKRRARYYELTAAGRQHLARELESFDRVMLGITRVLRTT